MRSVSLTRQLPIPVSVVGPLANSATIASVIAASGIATQSISMPASARARGGLDPVVAVGHRRAHSRQRVGEGDVTLDRIAADAGDAHRSAGDGTRREKIRCRRGVALDANGAGTFISRRRGDDEGTEVVVRDGHAEAAHQVQRQADIGLRDEIADDVDSHRVSGTHRLQRQRHQQRGQELARDVAANADAVDGYRLRSGARTDRERRVAGGAEIADVGTQRAKRIDEVSDRALVHARHADELVVAAGDGQHRRQRPKCGACVAEEQFRRADRNVPTRAVNHDLVGGPRHVEANAKRRQRIAHRVDVIGIEQPAHPRGACRKCREQQRAVRDAFGAGKRNRAAGRGDGVEIEKGRGPRRVARRGQASSDSGRRRRVDPRLPGAADVARIRERGFEAGAVGGAEQRGDAVELGPIGGKLGEERDAIGESDVAPHLRRARRNAREVAETASREAEQVLGIVAAGELVHQREGEDVRQVRHRGEDAIVCIRREHVGARAAGGPRRGDRGRGQGIGLCQRRQHHVAPRVQRGEGGGRARALGAGNRVRRNKARQRVAERRACRMDDVLLGAAGVGDDRLRAEMRGDRAQQGLQLGDRRGEQHEVGVAQFARPRTRKPVAAVDDAEVLRLVEVELAPAHADDAADLARRAQRQRERAADQPHADDDQLVDARRRGVHVSDQSFSRQARGRVRRGSGGSPRAGRR